MSGASTHIRLPIKQNGWQQRLFCLCLITATLLFHPVTLLANNTPLPKTQPPQFTISPLQILSSRHHETTGWYHRPPLNEFPLLFRPLEALFSPAHCLVLQHETTLAFPLPPNTSLRLLWSESIPQWQPKIAVSVGNGTGLRIQQPTRPDPSGHGLLIEPGLQVPGFVYLRLTGDNFSLLSVNLLFSLEKSYPPPLLHRCPIYTAAAFTVKSSDDKQEIMEPLSANDPLSLTLTGPLQLIIRHRLQYNAIDSARRADYRISLRLDQQPEKILEYSTLPETQRLFWRDDQPQVLARQRQSHLSIPKGTHHLRLNSTRDLLLGLYTLQDPAYLLPELNAPEEGIARQLSIKDIISVGPAWQAIQLKTGQRIPVQVEPGPVIQLAKQLSRGHHHLSGPFQGLALLEAAALAQPEFRLSYQRAASEIKGQIHFKNVGPAAKKNHWPVRTGYFIQRQLQQGIDKNPVATSQHRNGLMRTISHTTFYPFKVEETQDYYLPPRQDHIRLRLVGLHPEKETHFTLQTDLGKRYDIRLQPQPEHDLTHFRLAPGETGLALLAQQFPTTDRGTLGGPFSLTRQPAPLYETASTEIIIPATVKKISIQRLIQPAEKKDKHDTVVYLALQYQSHSPYRLTSNDLAAAIQHIGGRQKLLSLFQQWQNKAPTETVSEQQNLGSLAQYDLENEYRPLLEQLQGAAQVFAHAITPPLLTPTNPPYATRQAIPFNPEETEAIIGQAQALEAAGHPLSSLETWRLLQHRSQGKTQQMAIAGFIRTLRQLGEHTLAERYLRGYYLHPKTAAEQPRAAWAYQQLLQQYQSQPSAQKTFNLMAHRFLQHHDPALLPPLIDHLASANPHSALLLALLHPAPAQTAVSLAQISLRLYRAKDFEQALLYIKNPEVYAYYQGLWSQYQGDEAQAYQWWQQAGQLGKAQQQDHWLALEIATLFDPVWSQSNIQETQPQRQQKQQQAWLTWQKNRPGPKGWKNHHQAIQDFAATRIIMSQQRYTNQLAYLSTPDKPITLQVHEGQTLRFSCRPRHGYGSKQPLSGWVHLVNQAGDTRVRHPFSHNLPSPVATLIGHEATEQPGTALFFEYTVPPGTHSLSLYAPKTDLLVQVQQQQPLFGNPILPPYTPATFTVQNRQNRGVFWSSLIDGCLDPTTLLHRTDLDIRATCLQTVSLTQTATVWQKPVTAIRRRLQQLVPQPQAIQPPTLLPPLPLHPQSNTPPLLKQETPATPYQQLSQLTQLAEQVPAKRPEALTKAWFLYSQHRANPSLRPLITRPIHTSRWNPVELIDAPAGQQTLPHQGWSPESPALRIRHALLPPCHPGEEILYSDTTLLYRLTPTTPLVVTLHFRLLEPNYLPRASLQFEYQLNDETAELVQLTPAYRQHQVTLTLPPGEQQLRFQLQARYRNQFLGVRVNSVIADPNTRSKNRAYYLSTAEEPIQVTLKGPTLLRTDEALADTRLVSYQPVPSGWQTLTFPPRPGRVISHFRFQRKDPIPVVAQPSRVSLPRQPIPPLPRLRVTPLVHFGRHAETSLYQTLRREQTQAQWPIAGHEKEGHHTVTGKIGWRRLNDDDQPGDTTASFQELAWTHRLRMADMPGYHRFDALIRQSNTGRGGPLLGITEQLIFSRDTFPRTIKLTAQFRIQDPTVAAYDPSFSEQMAWSWRLKGTLLNRYQLDHNSYHLPSLSFTQWRMSLLAYDNRYPAQQVDPEIFSTYKQEHQNSVNLADTYYHQPWLDSLFYAGAGATTNTLFHNRFGLDHLTGKAGWRQLLGDLRGEVSYQGRYYLSDTDRASSDYRDTLRFSLTWEHWLNRYERIEAAIRLRHNLGTNLFTGYLSLSWYQCNIDPFYHFPDSEVPFRAIRDHHRAAKFSTPLSSP